jgi:hypothetical protein
MPLPPQLEAAEREKQHMQQRLQQQPQNGISQLKMQELNKQVGAWGVTCVLCCCNLTVWYLCTISAGVYSTGAAPQTLVPCDLPAMRRM